MNPDPRHAEFLAEIIAHRDDDTPRLIYADWLEEQGDGARAEFIRVQCKVEPLRGTVCICKPSGPRNPDCQWGLFQSLCERERELLPKGDRFYPADARNDYDYLTQFQFRRGFIAAITCSASDWLTHADAILKATPLEDVKLSAWGDTNTLDRLVVRFRQTFPRDFYIERLYSVLLKALWPSIRFDLSPLSPTGLNLADLPDQP